MLKMNKSTYVSGTISVGDKEVMNLYATIDDNHKTSITQNIYDFNLYMSNMEEIGKDISDYNTEVQKVVNQLKQEDGVSE